MEVQRKPYCLNRLKDEQIFLNDFIERNLTRSCEMFSYEGLPDEIPLYVYERELQRNGWLAVFRHTDGKLYALPCAVEGELNAYYEPIRVIVVNHWLNISRVMEIGKECEIIKSDSGRQGLLPIYEKYGLMTRTAELTLDTLAFLERVPFLITAKNLNERDNAREFLKKVYNGDYGIIAGNEFTESVKVDLTPMRDRSIADVVELSNYVQSRLFNEIGILADYNGMKKERTSGGDVQFATPSLIPFVENMLNERRQGWKRVNALFGTNVEVDFNSVWQLNGAFLASATAQYLNGNISDDVEKIDEKVVIQNADDDEPDGDSGMVDAKANDGEPTQTDDGDTKKPKDEKDLAGDKEPKEKVEPKDGEGGVR